MPAVGNDYLVMGTMERAAWSENRRNPKTVSETLDSVADFREELTVPKLGTDAFFELMWLSA